MKKKIIWSIVLVVIIGGISSYFILNNKEMDKEIMKEDVVDKLQKENNIA
ncbi:MAG: hypothetical protein K2J20_00400 [Bacilli bacterium]|nr:hypothetical protein [Bacilli bacterium]